MEYTGRGSAFGEGEKNNRRRRCYIIIASVVVWVLVAGIVTFVLINKKDKGDTDIFAKISGEDKFQNEDSPQSKALAWIENDHPQVDTGDESILITRYTLMVLYFSLGGENWESKGFWGTSQNECRWVNIDCDDDGNVRSLNLSSLFLSGSIPNEVIYLENLEIFDVSANDRLKGTIPSSIGVMKKLAELRMIGCSITGSIPSSIRNLLRMQVLELNDNALTGSMWNNGIEDLTKLEILSLNGNELKGSIPSDVRSLTKLKAFDASRNELTGTIPSHIALLTELEYLVLSDLGLRGTIPEELVNLSLLQTLKLNNNILSGTIPSLIDNLTELQSLNLKSNLLIGSIPGTMGDLMRLRELDLSFNELTGYIPVEMDTLTNLSVLRVPKLAGIFETSYDLCIFLPSLRNNTEYFIQSTPINCTFLGW